MKNIQPISVLRQTDILDQVSEATEPLFITKNGRSYLVILSPDYFEQLTKEREHLKNIIERERELQNLVKTVQTSREQIEKGRFYTEAGVDQMMEKIIGQ